MNEVTAIDKALFNYLLWLGDNSLILGHRLSEWCGHGPIIEEDIALTNISLDHIGQARLYLSYAGEIEGKGRSEDDLAYLRDVLAYQNSMLVEQPNGDFGFTMMRQFLFTAFNYHLQNALCESSNEQLRAIARKAIKETTYHLRHCSDWILRLGDGTEESLKKVQDAIDIMWMYTADMFETEPGDKLLLEQKIIPVMTIIRSQWEESIKKTLGEANIKIPASNFMFKGGRQGKHTEYLGFILAEMQFLPRAYPDAKW